MRVLVVKMSSMGDIIHTLPALTDALSCLPHIQFDWVAERAYEVIPMWHPAVRRVLPIDLRLWRKQPFSLKTRLAWQAFKKNLQTEQYDMVLDAQGLVKSALLCLAAKGMRVGLGVCSARESLAALLYTRRCRVNFYQHAVTRMRLLFSQALGYAVPETAPHFGVQQAIAKEAMTATPHPYMVFLHGTSWTSKQWPEGYWQQLIKMVGERGYRVKIGGGTEQELARAKRLAAQSPYVDLLPPLEIAVMARLLANAKAAVAVDTGFGHLAAALDIPTVSLYGATNPMWTRAMGLRSVVLSAQSPPCVPCLRRVCTYRESSEVMPACYRLLTPDRVWQLLERLLHVTE